MFTGIIERLATVEHIVPEGPGCRIVLRDTVLPPTVHIGQSIAVNGCCLTVVEASGTWMAFQAGEETLSRTNLGRLQPGDSVNLERAMQLGDRLDGHMVTGHVDAVGTLDQRRDDADWSTCWFRAPFEQLRQMAPKGSVAIDGVSLTLVEVTNERFSVALIPHTLAITTLGARAVGDAVNLETDLLAKYVARLLATQPTG